MKDRKYSIMNDGPEDKDLTDKYKAAVDKDGRIIDSIHPKFTGAGHQEILKAFISAYKPIICKEYRYVGNYN